MSLKCSACPRDLREADWFKLPDGTMNLLCRKCRDVVEDCERGEYIDVDNYILQILYYMNEED